MNNINLKLNSLSKSFFIKKIFECLSYEFMSGCCYAITGSNGIGKSTLLSMMSGSIDFDSGAIIINNIDLKKQPNKAKKYISYVPDGVPFYPFMTGQEFIYFISAAKKSSINDQTEELINKLNLYQFMHISFANMSLGTQRKFLLIAATIGDPDIYILDEPTNAIDKASREIFTNYLSGLREKKTIIFSTHDNTLIDDLRATELRIESHPINQLVPCIGQ